MNDMKRELWQINMYRVTFLTRSCQHLFEIFTNFANFVSQSCIFSLDLLWPSAHQGFYNHGLWGSPGWIESVCCDFSVKIVGDVIMKINVSRHCLNFRGSIHGFPPTLGKFCKFSLSLWFEPNLSWHWVGNSSL